MGDEQRLALRYSQPGWLVHELMHVWSGAPPSEGKHPSRHETKSMQSLLPRQAFDSLQHDASMQLSHCGIPLTGCWSVHCGGGGGGGCESCCSTAESLAGATSLPALVNGTVSEVLPKAQAARPKVEKASTDRRTSVDMVSPMRGRTEVAHAANGQKRSQLGPAPQAAPASLRRLYP